jgi:hypothetical protein
LGQIEPVQLRSNYGSRKRIQRKIPIDSLAPEAFILGNRADFAGNASQWRGSFTSRMFRNERTPLKVTL